MEPTIATTIHGSEERLAAGGLVLCTREAGWLGVPTILHSIGRQKAAARGTVLLVVRSVTETEERGGILPIGNRRRKFILTLSGCSSKRQISVIIPAYNDADHLRICLSSLQKSGFQDYECIVVDDGSADS